MTIRTHFGEHKDESIEKVSLTNYSYLDYLIRKVDLYGEFGRRVHELVYILNNYLPYVNCKSCNSTAKNIAIPYQLTHEMKRDYSTKSSSFHCEEQNCLDILKEGKYEVYPIKFEIVIGFNKEEGKVLHKILRRTIGFENDERVTDKKADELILRLEKERLIKPLGQSKLNLF